MDTDLFDILCNIDQCRHLIPEGSYIDLCRSLKRIREKLKAEKKKASKLKSGNLGFSWMDKIRLVERLIMIGE